VLARIRAYMSPKRAALFLAATAPIYFVLGLLGASWAYVVPMWIMTSVAPARVDRSRHRAPTLLEVVLVVALIAFLVFRLFH